MTRWVFLLLSLTVAFSCPLQPSFAAQGDDPDWPCIQRKVPELSIGQIWTDGQLPAAPVDWQKDAAVASLVAELSARKLPLPEAEQRIREFAKGLSDEQRLPRMMMLVQGLFDHMNRERSHVIAGIGRYAARQRELAAELRQEASAVDALRERPDASANELAVRADRLLFETRIFQERVQSLTFVCEVPTLIEQRLYALAKTIAEALPPK
jgi:hypothetical protein